MDDEFPLKIAVDRAWTVHLAMHKEMDATTLVGVRYRDTWANDGRRVKAIQIN